MRRIIALAPDLVLLNEEENRREDAGALKDAGLVCHVSFPENIPETAAMVRDIGAALHAREPAERIARDIETRAGRVRDACRDETVLTWAYLIRRQPWMTVNHDTFAHALLCLAGGRNVFAEQAERYAEISVDELSSRNPDLVLLCTEPFPFAERHVDELVALSGLPRERFRIADGESLTWHGSRTPDGIDYAESLIREARARTG